jgi:hypothetical protein
MLGIPWVADDLLASQESVQHIDKAAEIDHKVSVYASGRASEC